MRNLLIIIVVTGSLVGYVQYTFYKKKQVLLTVAQPFQQECQTENGCVISPNGWEKQHDYFLNDFMQYKATKSSFSIHYHIAADTWLLAKGGKNVELTVQNIGEFK